MSETFCYECKAPIVEVTEGGKRVRGRRCRQCKNAAVVRRRHTKPLALLQHRFYNSAHRMWPHADPSLWCIETVRTVYDRCQGKSVLSGESNAAHLCISFKHKDLQTPPPLEDLVVITTKEAQSLAHMSPEKRAKHFEEKQIE